MILSSNLIGNEKSSLTWRIEWLWKYESPWSIFEKIKYANSASDYELFLTFGNSLTKGRKKNNSYKKERCLKHLWGFDSKSFEHQLGLDLIQKNKDNIDDLLFFANDIDIRQEYIHDKLKYCPECIQYGYHSIFHQMKLFNYCPFHNKVLQCKCPECGIEIPYMLSEKYTTPFTCLCGYELHSEHNYLNFIKKWSKKHESEIKNSDLIKWLNLSKTQKNRIENLNFHFNQKIVNYHYENLIKYFLLISNEKFASESNYIYYMRTKRKNRRLLFYYGKESEIKFFSNIINSVNLEIYDFLWGTFRGIEKYIKRFLFFNHKITSALKKMSIPYCNIHDKCPYIYAYTIWLKYLQGIDYYFKHRNNLGTQPWYKNSYLNDAELIEILDEFYFQLKKYFCELNGSNYDEYKWIFNNFVSGLLINHYFNTLEHVRLYLGKGLEPPDYPLNFKTTPLYFIKYPEKNHSNIEIHWWFKKINSNIGNNFVT